MAGILLRRSRKSGLPPGTPVYVGEEERLPAHITVISYDEASYNERTV